MKKVKFIAIMIAVCITQIICGVLVFADTEPADTQVYSDTASNQSEKSENGLPQIEYESGPAGTFFTFGQPTDGKLIVAQYDDNNVLTALKTYDVTNASKFQIPNKDIEGFSGKIKCMLWSDFQDFKPKANPLQKQFRSITLSAEDIDDAKTDVSAGVLYFYPAGETRGSVKYAIDENTIYYVNGVCMGVLDSEAVNKFIVNDENATVTLQKESAAGSAGLPSKYSKVMISKHVTAVVDQVVDSTEDSKILFKDMSEGISTYIKVYKHDDTYRYSFTLNGEEIDPSELKENDVLTIYNDHSLSFADSKFYDVEVSRNTAEGICSGWSSAGDLFTFSGVKYGIAAGMVCDFEVATKYKLYLDVFGRIACFDEIVNPKTRGILKNIYRKADGNWVAEVITNEGIIQTYNVNEYDVEEYQQYLTNESSKLVAYPQQVIDYRVNSSGILTIKNVISAVNTVTAEYKEKVSKIGSIAMSDTTTIIDISGVDTMRKGFSAVSADRLIDGEEYTVYAYDKSAMNNTYRLIIITAGKLVEVEEEYTENTGILTAIYQKANGDWVANIIDKDCKSNEYVIDDNDVEDYRGYIVDSYDWKESYPKQVIKYKTTKSGKFEISEALTETLFEGPYSAQNSEIGSLKISDTSVMLNITTRYDNSVVSLDRLTDGEEYTVYAYNTAEESDSYDLILFTDGNIAEKYTEGIGILKNAYRKANGDFVAEVITKEGQVVEYAINESVAMDIASHFGGTASYGLDYTSGLGRTKDDYVNQIIEYKTTTSGKLIVNEYMTAKEEINSEYNAAAFAIGSVQMSDETIIIDISNIESKKDDFYIISKDNLRDGAMYTAYGYDKSMEDCSYSFVIITERISGPYSDSQLAIFLESGIDLDEYDNVVDTMTLYYDNEKITYVVDEDSMVDVMDYREGDLLIFSLNYSGKINEAYPVFNYSGLLNSSTYEDFKNIFYNGDILSSNDWSALLSDGKEDVDIQFGVIVKLGSVYALAEEIRYDDNGYYIDLSQAKEIVISPDTKIYTYNFANSPRNWGRIVLNDDMHYTPDIKDAYENSDMSSDKYYISHEDVEDNVVLAVIRTFNDNEVQEIYQMINE